MSTILLYSDQINIIVLALLGTLSIYHFFIFIGRGVSDGKYYLAFSLLSLSLAVFITLSCNLRNYVFDSVNLNNKLGGILSGLSYTIFIISARYVLPSMIVYHEVKKRIYVPFYIILFLFISFNSTVLFTPYWFYMSCLYPISSSLATLSACFLFFVTGIALYKQKQLFHLRNGILFLSGIILIIDLVGQRVIRVIMVEHEFNGIYAVTGLVALMWAYILSLRFNEEYKELKQVKANLELRIIERTRQLEEALAQKNKVFTNIAHELKTPITLAHNYLSKYLNEHYKNRDLEVVEKNIMKLVRDVHNLFDTEKFKCGLSIYNNDQTINLSTLLDRLVKSYLPSLGNIDLLLNYKIDDDLYIQADPVAIERIVANLIENAIKYSGSKSAINIELQQGKKEVILIIEDNGVGIPAELHEKIFDPNFQITSNKNNTQGMGMGLSIVKNLVHELRGRILLESNKGEGARFIMIFPEHQLLDKEIKKSEYPFGKQLIIDQNEEIEDSIQGDSAPSLLLIEDNPDMLVGMQNQLKNAYNIYVATSGKEALEKISVIPCPDLIVSDVMMDEMDGYELLAALSCNKRFSHIPFLFVSASSSTADKLRGVQLGAVDYLSKPFLMDELQAKIVSILSMVKRKKHAVLNHALQFISNEMDAGQEVKVAHEYFIELNFKKYLLTSREREVIEQIAQDRNSKEIGSRLCISERTVSKHIENIYRKVSVKDKAELIKKIYN